MTMMIILSKMSNSLM